MLKYFQCATKHNSGFNEILLEYQCLPDRNTWCNTLITDNAISLPSVMITRNVFHSHYTLFPSRRTYIHIKKTHPSNCAHTNKHKTWCGIVLLPLTPVVCEPNREHLWSTEQPGNQISACNLLATSNNRLAPRTIHEALAHRCYSSSAVFCFIWHRTKKITKEQDRTDP